MEFERVVQVLNACQGTLVDGASGYMERPRRTGIACRDSVGGTTQICTISQAVDQFKQAQYIVGPPALQWVHYKRAGGIDATITSTLRSSVPVRNLVCTRSMTAALNRHFAFHTTVAHSNKGRHIQVQS